MRMDDSYGTRLREFAEGKRLGRLTSTVPSSREDRCDACGSSQPRTLFGVKDVVSGRCYFVGQNCLAWLIDNGMVARARYRDKATSAYNREMELRRNGTAEIREVIGVAPGRLNARAQGSKVSSFRRIVLVVERGGEYRALVRLSDGRRSVSARAGEPCWRWEWTRHDGGALLDRVWRPRRALGACVLRAHRDALERWRTSEDPRSK
jgi:hypothetical protein